MFFSQLTSFVVFWTVWVFYIKYANKDYLYKEEREEKTNKHINTEWEEDEDEADDK